MADKRIDFSTFFDFNDEAPIADAIKIIEKLESAYEKFVNTVEKQSAGLSDSMEQVKTDAGAILKSLDSLNNAAAKNADAYEGVSKGVDDLAASQNLLKSQMDDNSKTIVNATTQLNNLKKAKEDLVKINQNEEGSVDDLKAKLDSATKSYKAMGDATDQAVKDDQLKKIADLNAQYKTATQALNDAKKATDNASGSYNDLKARVATATAQLKAMGDGVGNTSKEMKLLQAQIKADNETLNKFDEGIKSSEGGLAGVKNQLTQLVPGFQGVAGAIDSASTAGKAFIATPLGAVIAAIALAVSALTAYFKGSIEGQDNWNKVMAYASAVADVFIDALKSLGKWLYNIKDNLQPVADLLSDMWENPTKYLKEFGDFLISQVVNRFIALGDILEAVGKIIKSGFTDGFKDLGNAVLKLETGFDKLIDKAVEFGTEAYDAAQKALEAAKAAAEAKLKIELALAEKENLIRKEKIKDVVDDAQTELKVNELLEQSKDKLTFMDEDRLKKVRTARKLLSDQVQGDIELAQLEVDAQKLRINAAGGLLIAGKKLSEYTNDEIKNIGVKYELVEELARLEADQIKIEADAATKRKALLKQEIALIQEISKAYFDRLARERQATDEINTYIAQSTIKRNNEILADEDATLEERIQAISSNFVEEQKLLDINYQKQLDATREDSISKIELNDETIKKIYSDQSKSLQQQIQEEHDAKEQALMNDAKYSDEKQILIKKEDKLFQEYTDNTINGIKKATDASQNNAFKVLDRDWKILTANINADVSSQQDALNQAYIEGTVSMKDFEKQRTQIQANGVKERLQAELDYLSKVLNATNLTEQQRAELEAKSADIRKQLSASTADQILANEQKLRSAIQEIQGQAFQFAQTLIAGQLQSNLDSINAEMGAAQAKHDKSIALAGDDAQAKAIIDAKFAAKKMELDKKAAAEKRKAAIAAKVLAVAETVINTARAVSAALPVIPLAVAVGVLGALQVATIIAQPIPAYEKGTKSSQEGWALVAEKGPELGIHNGEATLYTDKQYAYLKGGTEIKTASETRSLMQDAKQFGDGYMFNQRENAFKNSVIRMSEARENTTYKKFIAAVKENTQMVVGALSRLDNNVWDDEGYRRFTRDQNTKIELRNKKKYEF